MDLKVKIVSHTKPRLQKQTRLERNENEIPTTTKICIGKINLKIMNAKWTLPPIIKTANIESF